MADGRAGFEFKLLGPLEVTSGGRAISLGGQKQRALLALLLVRANEVVPRDRLIDGLWGDSPPGSAANALQVAVHGLRKALGSERIETQGTAYRIRVQPGEVDVQHFERLVEEARRASSTRAAEGLREALALWRGPALADLDHTPSIETERSRLDERRLTVLEERIEADLALGRHGEVAGELDAFVMEHPYRERLRHLLMLALYRSGRQAEALNAYQDARRALVGELARP